MRRSLASIQTMAAHRPAGYYEDVLSRGIVVGDQLELSAQAYADLVAKYRKGDGDDWPFWAFMVAGFSSAQDRGIGDTVRREFGSAKGEGFKRFHEAMFGIWAAPCDCAGKIAAWNALYPYATWP